MHGTPDGATHTPGSGLPKPALRSASRDTSRSPPLEIRSNSRTSGPLGGLRIVDVSLRLREASGARLERDDRNSCGRPFRVSQPSAASRDIAVRTTPLSISRHSRNSSSVPSHTDPPRGTIASPIHGNDDGAGARGLALELVDDARQRMRHRRGIARLVRARQWTGATMREPRSILRDGASRLLGMGSNCFRAASLTLDPHDEERGNAARLEPCGPIHRCGSG
jgi:hypothetical protein